MKARTALFVYFLICLPTIICLAQISDNFSQANKIWYGDTSYFIINSEQQLQLNDIAGGNSFLYSPNTLLENTEWEILAKLDFSPSGSNFARIYLTADTTEVGVLNGYYLQLGEGGSDDGIDLRLINNEKDSLLIKGKDGSIAKSVNTFRVKVTRDNKGNWSLYTDTLGGENYVLEGRVLDNTLTRTKYFGLYCQYTSSRSDKFYFDDVYVGSIRVDTTAPSIDSLVLRDQRNVMIKFSEPIKDSFLISLANNTLQSQEQLTDTTFLFTFQKPFPNQRKQWIVLENVQDFKNNKTKQDSIAFTYTYNQTYDVLITEIMATPSPSVLLPEIEYIELYNHTKDPINIMSWRFQDATSEVILPSYELASDSFVILCEKRDSSLLAEYGFVIGLSSFPSLNNSGDSLKLYDLDSILIHTVNYNNDWHENELKQIGGWALELKDFNYTCNPERNWSSSRSSLGGTPGRLNSIHGKLVDSVAPEVIHAEVQDSSSILILFSEKIDSGLSPKNFILSPSSVIDSLYFSNLNQTEISIKYQSFLQEKTIYTLQIESLLDCSYNVSIPHTYSFGIPSRLDLGDIIINEILFNPKSGGVDFVEIYNPTDQIFDLSDLRIANVAVSVAGQPIDQVDLVTEEPYYWYPHQYLAITEDTLILSKYHRIPDTAMLYEINDLPTLPDDEGGIVLLNKFNEELDRFIYDENMHQPIISDPEGVSLERSSFNSNYLWHSAASMEGYATPGYINSQYTEPNVQGEPKFIAEETITLSSEVFSPNGDGYQDELLIYYHFEEPNFVITLTIYTLEGQLVQVLANNELASSTGKYTWNGNDESGNLSKEGIHILVVEGFSEQGKMFKTKKPFAIAGIR